MFTLARLRPLEVLAVFLALLLIIGLYVFNWSVFWAQILPFYAILTAGLFTGLGVMAAAENCARWGRLVRSAGSAIYMLSLFYLIAATGAFACSVLATSGLPYVDDQLHAVDWALGFDWVRTLNVLLEYPLLLKTLSLSYASIGIQQQAAIILLAFLSSQQNLRKFMFAWTLCLVLTTLMFPFFPAVAAFDYYHIDFDSIPAPTAVASWNLTGLMEAIRTGENAILDADDLTGPVTMPSLHAAMAVLLGATYWKFDYIRWPMALLNVGMFFSAVHIGGHYFVDIVVGGVMAVACLRAARYFYPLQNEQAKPADKPQPQPAFT